MLKIGMCGMAAVMLLVGGDEALSDAQRKMGLETLNAEASFQRLLSEPRRRTEPLEPLMTLLTYTRRFAASIVSIASSFQYLGMEGTGDRLAPFVSAAERGISRGDGSPGRLAKWRIG